jgi:hypothetical protein
VSSLSGDIFQLISGGTETRRYVCQDLFYNAVVAEEDGKVVGLIGLIIEVGMM